jgi:hypothetical protein
MSLLLRLRAGKREILIRKQNIYIIALRRDKDE